MLLGMAWAFVGLHDAIATSESTELLSVEKKEVLLEIARKEQAGLQVCLDELKGNEAQYTEFCKGFEMAEGRLRVVSGEK